MCHKIRVFRELHPLSKGERLRQFGIRKKWWRVKMQTRILRAIYRAIASLKFIIFYLHYIFNHFGPFRFESMIYIADSTHTSLEYREVISISGADDCKSTISHFCYLSKGGRGPMISADRQFSGAIAGNCGSYKALIRKGQSLWLSWMRINKAKSECDAAIWIFD